MKLAHARIPYAAHLALALAALPTYRVAEGEGDPKPDDGKPLTRAEAEKFFNDAINGAVRANNKRLEDSIAKMVGGLEKRFEDLAGAARSGAATGGDGGAADDKTKDGKPRDEGGKFTNPQLVEAQRKIAELEEKERKREAEIKEARKKADQREERDALRVSLKKLKVRDDVLELLATKLHLEDGVIVRDGSGKIRYKWEGRDGEELLPLEDGLKNMLQTDQGKVYVAPRGATGSGAKPPAGPAGSVPRGNSPPRTRQQLDDEGNSGLLEAIGDMIGSPLGGDDQ